jgi:hypothetical protein
VRVNNTDGSNIFLLDGPVHRGAAGETNNTWTSCQAFCSGYKYAGLENGGDCRCGNTFTYQASGNVRQVDPTTCQTVCNGANLQYCGGDNRMTLFVNSQYAPPQLPKVRFISYTLSMCSNALCSALKNVLFFCLSGKYGCASAQTTQWCGGYEDLGVMRE